MNCHQFNVIMEIFIFIGILTGEGTAFLLGSTCDCPPSFTGSKQGFVEKTFSKLSSNVTVVNPGRGFYRHIETRTSSFHPLSSWSMGPQNNVLYRQYYLDTFLTSDLDTTFTDKVKADLKLIQGQGLTVILRFAYSNCCVQPPYHDPSYSRMLSHIRKLDHDNVFRDYEGIIVAIQAGFVGVWGEWHFTTSEFGITKYCSSVDLGLTDAQWANRNGILQALLDAAPPSIEILVRIPEYKFHLYDKVATTLSDEKTRAGKSRIGFYNDAFLSDLDQNMGTFKCTGDRTYMADDSRYNYVTGETNDAKTPAAWTCANAMKELAQFHYSSLNTDYLKEIIDSWKENGCYDVISAHLGYRLYLTKAILPSSVTAGGEFCYHIEINNEGYAAPNKEMEAHIVLENSGNGALYSVMVPGVEVRAWLPGNTYTLQGAASVPAAVPSGNYKVHFVLLNKVLGRNNKYFVLMANENGVQNTTTRMNSLGHTIDVTSGHCNSQSAAVFHAWQQTGNRR